MKLRPVCKKINKVDKLLARLREKESTKVKSEMKEEILKIILQKFIES